MLKAYVAARAFIKNKDKFLILKIKESDQNDDLVGWETPGGRIEEGEEIISGLNREIAEETGIKVNILFPFCAYFSNEKTGEVIVHVDYLGEYISGDVEMDKSEHLKFMWATSQQIKRLAKNLNLQKEIAAYEDFVHKNKKTID